MTINYVGHSVSTVIDNSTNTTISGSFPSGGANGNLLIACIASNSSLNPNSVSAPSGWTQLVENYSEGSFRAHVQVSYAVRSDALALTWTVGGDIRDDQLIITEWSGEWDTASPISLATIAAPGTAVTFTSPSQTTTANNSVFVAGAAARNGGAAADLFPDGMTGIINQRSRANSSAVRSALAYEQRAVAGATGTRTWTDFVSTAQIGNALSLVINHAAEQSGPSINPTGTDTDLVNGTSSSLVVQNTVSDPVSITVIYDDGVADPISSVQSDFVMGTITDGAGTATFTDTIGNLPYSDGVTYLAAGYSYLVTCADDSTFTLDTLTFAPATGRDFVVAVDPVSDETGILYQWESGGPVTGDQIDYQTDAVTVREDFTFFGPAGESGVTLYINYWDSVSQIRYPVTVIVAFDESGEGTVTGMLALSMIVPSMAAPTMLAITMEGSV